MTTKPLDHYKKYGWAVSEKNLETLPPTAPKAANDLAKWLTLDGRKKALITWLGCVNPVDTRIHGTFWHIGAWTQRMAHSNPNQANIAACWPEDDDGNPIPARNAVEEVKKKYDSDMRSCWKVPKGSYLVGCDASGIQLRILAHYMKSEEYRDAILSGDSKLGTDIHSLNKRALGPVCHTRDDSKTFIYAWLLGAGIPKIASILKTNNANAKIAVDNFLKALPELNRLKSVDIKRDASKGFFTGLDGRKVKCNSEHLMLAGYLQNGESVIMKTAMVRWHRLLQKECINFKVVDFVHDEWQVEVIGSKEDAERAGEIMAEAIRWTGDKLNLFCPLDGEPKIGFNWKDTH